VDGEVGFIGGAGISDVWSKELKGEPPWRDTVCRVEGPLVTGLQTTFAENWLEASEEILADEEYFPSRTCAAKEGDDGPGDVAGFVVISAPSAGRSTRARILFQTLLASATKSIHINSPYFMPDRSARAELCRAVKRGVEVKIITPGDHADHLLTRRSSRRRYGELLRCGAEIHEYQPAMIHAKILIVDGVWSVVGSTNFDNRSFGINDEVNLAAMNGGLAARLEEDFVADLSKSRRISYEEWSRRPLRERLVEMFGMLLERQQ
jgi:cardiolipin synthase